MMWMTWLILLLTVTMIKEELIFTNTNNQQNGEIYGQIQLEIQERAAKRNSKFMFSISQMRKKC